MFDHELCTGCDVIKVNKQTFQSTYLLGQYPNPQPLIQRRLFIQFIGLCYFEFTDEEKCVLNNVFRFFASFPFRSRGTKALVMSSSIVVTTQE